MRHRTNDPAVLQQDTDPVGRIWRIEVQDVESSTHIVIAPDEATARQLDPARVLAIGGRVRKEIIDCTELREVPA